MRKFKVGLLLTFLSCLLLSSATIEFNQASYAASAAEINTRTQTALSEFRQTVPDASTVLKDAHGVLVFPHLYQGAFVFGGKYGEGSLIVNNKVAGYYNLAGVSWGFQAGGQRQSLIIAFMTDDALSKFMNSSGWDIGADASVAVVDVGTQGSLRASRFNKPVLAFVVDQKGLMGGVSLQGSKITKINK